MLTKKLKLGDIPLTDPYVYEFIGTGRTSGIFQIESAGMQNLMKQMFADVSKKIRSLENTYSCKNYDVQYVGTETDTEKVEEIKRDFKAELDKFGKELFERIIAAISLYRPGPMDYIPEYIGNMNSGKINYDVPELEEILKDTYGVIVYQEQVQQIVRKLAGYSLGRGDLIRRAMGKKKIAIMNAEREVFINGNEGHLKEGEALVPGCIKNGIPEDKAIIIWDKMAEFAKYAFNKSHSAGYAVICIQTAWLKFYYPVDFMCGTINSVIDKSDKLTFYISQTQDMGIKILGPDINKSEGTYTIEDDGIRTGLVGLRNLGKMAAPILEERNANGPFKSIEDFVDRLISDINKKVLESLIYAGALDCFNGSRRAKIMAVPSILEFATFVKKGNFPEVPFNLPEIDAAYSSLKTVTIPEFPEYEKSMVLEKEYEFAGMFITGHPLDQYEDILMLQNFKRVNDIIPEKEENDEEVEEEKEFSPLNGENIQIAGIIRDKKQIVTKNGKKMYMFSIEDKTGTIKCVAFPKVAEACEGLIQDKSLVIIKGKVEDNERGCQIIVSTIEDMDTINLNVVKSVWIDGRKTPLKEITDFVSTMTGPNKLFIQTSNRDYLQVAGGLKLDWTNYMKLKEAFNVKIK